MQGFGRISIFTGDVRDDIVPTMSLDSTDSSHISFDKINQSIDITNILLDNDLMSKLSSHNTDNAMEREVVEFKMANNISVTLFPFNKQIVLDGRICRSDLFDKDGNCNFDRSQIVIDENLVKDSEIKSYSSSSSSLSTESSSQVASECPVCRFMKGGECKDQFLEWDECMSKLKEEDDVRICYGQTAKMMECMKKHEYYDIMVAGTSYSSTD